jgi:hypothetical protein
MESKKNISGYDFGGKTRSLADLMNRSAISAVNIPDMSRLIGRPIIPSINLSALGMVAQFNTATAELQKSALGMQDAMRRFNESVAAPWQEITRRAQQAFSFDLRGIVDAMRPVGVDLRGIVDGMRPFHDVFVLIGQADRLKDAGWIPHPALPIRDLVGSETDSGVIASNVERYVRDNREAIYAALSGRYAAYSSDLGSPKLREHVVEAHRAELYSLIVPAIFPEIERCARSALGFSTTKRGKKVIDNFVLKINDLPVSAFEVTQLGALTLIDEFIYKSYAPGADIGIPHRHGAEHGLDQYDTSRTCLNAMFLLDFVLGACQALHKRPRTSRARKPGRSSETSATDQTVAS